MSPKEKAVELYNKYAVIWHGSTDDCKKQVVICIDEVLSLRMIYNIAHDMEYSEGLFYEAVKEELLKL